MNRSCRQQFTGVIGGRLIGSDPYDPAAWSGISRFFFRECQRQGILYRALGADLPRWQALLLMAKNFHADRRVWRQHYYLDPQYRRALTRAVRARLEAQDMTRPLLQIGALFDLPGLAKGRTRVFSYHDGNLAMRLRSPYGTAGLSRRRQRQAWEYERGLYQRIDCIFTMSDYLRRSFIEDFGVDASRVVNVGAGVNLDAIPDRLEEKNYASREILFIGVEFERKGGHVLLSAFAKVRNRFPDAVLHVAGPRTAPPEALPLAGVQWHGFLNKENRENAERLQTLFQRSSLFVLPSLYEPFGIAPAEAMMHGLPAVVTGDWALGETVINGVTGAHVKAGEAHSLEETMTRLLSEPRKLQEMGCRARDHALEKFLWAGVVEKMRLCMDAGTDD